MVKSERSEIRNVYIFALFQGVVNLTLPLGIQAIINLLQAGELRASWIVLVIFVILGVFFNGLLQLRQMAITEAIVEDQIRSKESSVSGYMQKVGALDRQIDALNESAKLERSQTLIFFRRVI